MAGFVYPLAPGVAGSGREGMPLLFERDNPDEFLLFHYKPESFRRSAGSKWSPVEIPGDPNVKRQWLGGKAQEYSLQARWNEYGQGKAIQKSVDDSIKWLEQRAQHSDVNTGFRLEAAAPPVLIFLYGNISWNVVLLDSDTDVLMVDQTSGQPVRAISDIQIARWSDYGT